MSSVDGRLLPSRWTPPFNGTEAGKLFAEYAAIGHQLDTDAWMFGKATAREASIFEYLGASDECPASEQSLELISSRTFDNGIVWLRYRFHRDGL